MVDGIAFVDARVGGVVASMRIYCIEEHLLNAYLSMLVIPVGRVISAREEQLLNVNSLMLVSCVFSRFITRASFSHESNA